MSISRRQSVILALVLLLSLLWRLQPGILFAAETVRVEVGGLQGKPLENVRAFLRLPPGVVAKEGEIDQTLFEEFKNRIPASVEEALQPFGYYNSETRVDASSSKEGYLLHVSVDPGKQTLVTSLAIKLEGPGASEGKLEKVVDAFPLKQGAPLLSEDYEKGKSNIQTTARGLGYLDADFSEHLINVFKTTGTAEIRLTLRTGERYYFGAVSFSDAPRYPDAFLRRYLAFKEGDVFSNANLTRTSSNLYSSDRFREVFVRTDKLQAEERAIPVSFDLTPSPERRIKTGVGYGTDTGPRFLAQYQDLNVQEKGNEFRADLSVSQVIYGIGAAYIFPAGESFRDSTAVRLSLLRETPVTYTSNIAQIEIDRQHSFSDTMQGTAFFRILEENFTIGGQSETSFLVLPGLNLYSQYYDNPTRPSKGYRYGVELRGTDTFLGSSASIVQVLPVADVLIPLPERLTVLLRSQGGVSFQRQAFEQVPVSLRFFAGGDQSVRGYSYQELGPKDSTGTVVGGKNLLFGSIEVERAVGESWGIAGFYDIGNAFDSFADMALRDSAGLGLHYYSKVGPFRLDVAQQLNGPNLARRIHFTMGIFL